MKSISQKMSIVAILLVFHVTKCLAESFIVDGIGYNILSESTVAVTYKTYMERNIQKRYYYEGDIVIPSTVTYQNKTYTVTSIAGGKYGAGGAFWYCSNLTNVTIPSTVTNIGDYAFSGCTSLTSIIIPNSVTNIGKEAFYDCISLTNISLPSGITSIGFDTFAKCSSLKNIVIPNSVITITQGAFSGCSGLTEVNIPNSVKSIGNSAFSGCTSLTKIVIPGSVNYIGLNAFDGCSGLTSVHISDIAAWCEISFGNPASNPLQYAKHLYLGEEEIKDLVIPNSVTNIGSYAFIYCSGLTSVTIPNSVTSIGNSAFIYCSGLTSVTIPNSVTSIGNYAFEDCTGLTSVTIPNSVKTIGTYAFSGCENLLSVKIGDGCTAIPNRLFYNCKSLKEVVIGTPEAGDNLSSIDLNAFPDLYGLEVYIYGQFVHEIKQYTNKLYNDYDYVHDNVKFYMHCPSRMMFRMWQLREPTYDIMTKQYMERPTLNWKCSQTTATITIGPIYDFANYLYDGQPLTETTFEYTGLKPGSYIKHDLRVEYQQDSYTDHVYEYTTDIDPEIYVKKKTPTSFVLSTSYRRGDANVTGTEFIVGQNKIEGDTAVMVGLEPNRTYKASFSVFVKYGQNNEKSETYTFQKEITTQTLTLTTLQPKVISPGNVIVAAQSNLKEEEENVGFEWRRTDWTDDFPSNSGQAYLYDGQMEGYIRNLNTDKLWKYRPYYESAAGTRYYGEWVGLDPTNTSYFEPTVHTYAQVNVQGNTASVRGYAMRGSDNTAEQGFKYWKSTASARAMAPGIPSNAETVTATGVVMEASLTNLDYESTYCYVAFVKTSEGETFYGDQRQFTTGVDPDGIEGTIADKRDVKPVAYYDLNGRRLQTLQPGLVIIRMSDGSVRKVMKK